MKHYAANNQEDDRLRVSAEVDERTLREIYLPAFEAVVKESQPWTVMCAYNKINGTYASEHHWLLTEVLRDEWGFDGVVMSDWGAVHDRVAALAAGLDLEMPPNLGVSDQAVIAAVRSGELDEAVLDETVRRMLRLVEQAQPALADPAHRGLRRASRPGPAGGRGVGGAAEERRRRPAAAPGVGQHGRGDRGVRPDAALSGRGQFPGEPDPGRRRSRRARGRVRRRASTVSFSAGFGVGGTEEDDAAGRRRPWPPPGTPITCWSSWACRPPPSRRASTGRTWICRPTSWRWSRPWPPCTTG